MPIWAAQHEGYFFAQGIDLTLSYTASSADLVAGLFEDRHDIALAGADNFIAYREGAGETAIGSEADLILCMGGDRGFLSLVGAPGIRDVQELVGRRVGVDAMTTGFAFVVRELLARGGVVESDVTFVKAGGTSHRYQALVEGSFEATLLRTPFDLLAIEQGFERLADARVLGPYQGTVVGLRRAWADAHRSSLVAFLRAYRDGLRWCLNESNRSAAAQLLAAHVKDLTPAGAADAVVQLLYADTGFQRDMRVDLPGVQSVLDLRRKYAPSPLSAVDVNDLIDHSFLEEALGSGSQASGKVSAPA